MIMIGMTLLSIKYHKLYNCYRVNENIFEHIFLKCHTYILGGLYL